MANLSSCAERTSSMSCFGSESSLRDSSLAHTVWEKCVTQQRVTPERQSRLRHMFLGLCLFISKTEGPRRSHRCQPGCPVCFGLMDRPRFRGHAADPGEQAEEPAGVGNTGMVLPYSWAHATPPDRVKEGCVERAPLRAEGMCCLCSESSRLLFVRLTHSWLTQCV